MGCKGPRRRAERRTQFETLENRQMFSAEPLGGSIEQHAPATPDFWYDTSLERGFDAMLGDVEQTLASAHALTGVTQARNDYGFTGAGQTVAVIDSGIAWDHPNLGNGFGANARVVGGWDFTEENDANPYDDGAAGSHGTHVAGIVGATANSAGDVGVAPGVDLVGLRVFNDQGDGYFSWVEKALRWVHTNRDAFANPITAVNLSLGTAYNAATVPSWATLEEEFAQLKADGIFIAVSAGNSFTTYNAAGLSYPAASSSVVPVMSVDDSGSLSYFSQRHSRAIAAPGRSIRSTVPDYVGNQNGVTDDWANYSGTSMASPYVAGASVLVREAMQFVGYANITEDTIYDHMMSTADEVFDAATSQFYKRLNVAAALDALVPEDEFGSTADTAHDLGPIGSASAEASGLIGKRDDADFFRFTATATGTVTLTVDTTHALAPVWTGDGAVSGPDGKVYTINVVAGESYTVGLSSSDGIGYFDLTVTAESEFTFVDWGTVAQAQWNDVAVNGESWYCVTAQQAGYFTAEAFIGSSGAVELAWFDATLQEVASSETLDGCERVDRFVQAGEQSFLRTRGVSDDVDFRLTNLVAVDGTTLCVSGTEEDDVLSFAMGSTHQLILNGIVYQFGAADVDSVRIDGAGGNDSVTITGTAGNETVELRPGEALFTGSGCSVSVTQVESIAVESNGGSDSATFLDSAGDDVFAAWNDRAVMTGGGFENTAVGFASASAVGSSGVDRASLQGSAGDDLFVARPEYARLSGATFDYLATGFDQVFALAGVGGSDRAVLYDSAGDDVFDSHPEYSELAGTGFCNRAQGFTTVQAYATAGGADRAYFFDSIRSDQFVASSTYARLSGQGFYNYGLGFEMVYAYATAGGVDQAALYDSAGNDQFVATRVYGRLSGSGFYNYASGFDAVNAYATAGGVDRAQLRDTAGNDTFVARAEYGRLSGAGFNNCAWSFDRVEAFSSEGGNDVAYLYDSAGDDVFVARPEYGRLSGAGFDNYAGGFDRVYAYATGGGDDRAVLYDSPGNDQLVAYPDYGRISGNGFYNYAKGFERLYAYASLGGVDVAQLYGSAGNDQFSYGTDFVRLSSENQYYNYAKGFANLTAFTRGGSPLVNVSAVDAAFGQSGT
jgi:subtilisin family serine protease